MLREPWIKWQAQQTLFISIVSHREWETMSFRLPSALIEMKCRSMSWCAYNDSGEEEKKVTEVRRHHLVRSVSLKICNKQMLENKMRCLPLYMLIHARCLSWTLITAKLWLWWSRFSYLKQIRPWYEIFSKRERPHSQLSTWKKKTLEKMINKHAADHF